MMLRGDRDPKVRVGLKLIAYREDRLAMKALILNLVSCYEEHVCTH